MARATFSPTASLPALKAYLQGEQFYRVAQWDSAQTHFERALSLDSTFALAYHRLAAVMRWRDTKEVPDSAAYVLMRRPSQFARGLGPRERLLATHRFALGRDVLRLAAGAARWRSTHTSSSWSIELCDALIEAMRRYPNDAELAFLHAEARAEYDRDVVEGELDDRATLARYDRAIALDSGVRARVREADLARGVSRWRGERTALHSRAYLALDAVGATLAAHPACRRSARSGRAASTIDIRPTWSTRCPPTRYARRRRCCDTSPTPPW